MRNSEKSVPTPMSEICITFWRKSEKSARFPPTSKNKKHVLFSIEIWKICEISTYFKNRKTRPIFNWNLKNLRDFHLLQKPKKKQVLFSIEIRKNSECRVSHCIILVHLTAWMRQFTKTRTPKARTRTNFKNSATTKITRRSGRSPFHVVRGPLKFYKNPDP